MKILSSLRLAAPLVFALTLLTSAVTADTAFDAFYGFGDSLADNGNDFILTKAIGYESGIPPSETPHKTYFRGRFSNGFVAFEYLWEMLSGNAPDTRRGMKAFLDAPVLETKGAVNFAFGGTGTPLIDQTPGGFYAPGLKGQVAMFRTALRGRKPSPRALYAIVTGANDYRIGAFNEPMAPPDVVQNIVDSVTSLYQAGARNIVVVKLPDLGLLPANSANREAATQVSIIHNQLLGLALGALPNRLPQINLIQIDMNDMLTHLPSGMNMTVPALATFEPVPPPGVPREVCLFVHPDTCVDAPTFDVGNQFLFWDIVHPTTAVHRVFAEYVHARLR